MRFDSLEEYDGKLDEMEKELAEMEEYIRKHPEKSGTAGNYETVKYVYDILKNERLEFINELSKTN